jgi:hypothetical protein
MKDAITSFKRKNSSITDEKSKDDESIQPKIAKDTDVELLQLSDDESQPIRNSTKPLEIIKNKKPTIRKKTTKKTK